MRRGELDHLAGADEQHPDVPEVLEQLAARRTAAAVMLIECAPISVLLRTCLATAKLRWNSWCNVLPSAPASSAARTAFFSWPRICASPSTMLSSPLATRKAWRGLAFAQHVGVVEQLLPAHAAGAREPLDGRLERELVGRAVDLGPVAGRQQRGLGLARQRRAEALQRLRQLVEREREPPAQIQRSSLVIDS